MSGGLVIFAILGILVCLGILLLGRNIGEYNGLDFLGGCIIGIFGIWLIIHVCIWINVPYAYESFAVQREAFVSTLETARENGTELENATILRDISTWNQTLARYQYENTLMIFDWCIDDRIDTLKPIQ